MESDNEGATVVRVLIHMPTLSARGGAERYAAEIAAVLRDAGHSVALAAVGDLDLIDLGAYFGLDLRGVELVRLPPADRIERMRPRRRAWQLRDALWSRRLRAWKPDVLVNTVYRSELHLAGVPLVVVCHFPHARPATATGLAGRVKEVLARPRAAFPPAGALVIANSAFTQEHIRRRWGVDGLVVHPPCPLTDPAAGSRETTILSVGRFTAPQPHVPNKRFDVMIEAFAGLEELHTLGYRLVLIDSAADADLAYVEGLRRRSRGLPIEIRANVPFAELQAAYATAEMYWHAQGYGEDVDDFPEAHEHFGMSVVEAMSGGAVPVVFGTAGPAEIVGPVDRGLLWHTRAELRRATSALAHLDPAEGDKLRTRLRQRSEEFSREAFRDRLLSVFVPLLRKD
ncbi:glycosyltransferase [Micrococcus sp. XM4230B]|uniref:glycosyltransferase n=1 Tax=Micrococcus sp. XM4230B TaxID=2929775 RepID=UPI001FF96B97|nr:glycosyltransferase [Micrococcus sp. XM4230B]MCK1799880.1 glycosyltransferase [Micrococcus sp. XM4230B]